MRSTFKLLFYINRNKVKSDGTTAVLCRISIDGKKSAVTTGVYCKPGDWDSKKCEIKTARENNRLAAFRSRLEEAYGNLLRNQGVVTAELLKTTEAPIPYRNTSCRPERWNANGSGSAPRRSTPLPPTASRRPPSSTSGSSSNPAG